VNQGAPGSLIPGSLDGTTDSDAKPTTGRTAEISLDAGNASSTGVNLTNVDAGITQGIPAGTASLGNRVWYDNGRDPVTGLLVPANANNGLQDAGELGVNNVKCELLDGAGTVVNVPGTSTPYVIYTNALGEYLFTGLPAGDYTVRFSNFPVGFTSSPANAGTPTNSNDAIDADASFAGVSTTTTTATTGVYTLQTGEDNLTVDMGIVPAAGTNTIGNFVWYDNGRDASGVLVPANASNGKQDTGEPGVQGVTVILYTNGVDGIPGTADDVRVGVTTTDNKGAYNFVGLPNGNYNVGFTNLPAGFTFTDKDKALVATADNSDANTASGRTGTYALTGGTNEREADAGLVSTRAALGNQVWLDTDGDGLLNNGEKGVSGVTVTLYDDATNAVLASTITDADGKYYFGNLLPGDYKVGFTTIPSNLSFTKQTTAGVADNNTNNNSDADPATGLTTKITLVAGETDLTIDAGLKPDNFASVGDLVWNDLDGLGTKSLTEPGVPGILVTLYDATTNLPVGTAITDGNGKYLISKIPVATAGTSFYIIFSNLPAGAQFTSQTDNVTPGDISLGSDANTATGRTSNFTLTPGQYLPTVDAGIKNVQVLPIKIASFTAVPKGSQVQLDWIVAEQINVATYEVLTSTDGRTFTSIATLAATANQSDNYNAIHSNPVAGLNYYRIKSIDKDGSVSYSDIRKVNFGKGGDVIIYPNPVQTGVINITLTGNMIGKSATVSIVSMDGKLISQQQIANTNQTETIDVSKLASGSYIVRLITNTEVVNKTIQVIR
jgi:SdrD B-like domain/Secretion system C-terminal sorting domain